jgi:hypothetical protein
LCRKKNAAGQKLDGEVLATLKANFISLLPEQRIFCHIVCILAANCLESCGMSLYGNKRTGRDLKSYLGKVSMFPKDEEKSSPWPH